MNKYKGFDQNGEPKAPSTGGGGKGFLIGFLILAAVVAVLVAIVAIEISSMSTYETMAWGMGTY